MDVLGFSQVTALVLIPLTWELGILVTGLILGGFVFFFILSKIGERLVIRNMSAENNSSNTSSTNISSSRNSSTSSSTNIMVGYNPSEEKKEKGCYSNTIDIKD